MHPTAATFPGAVLSHSLPGDFCEEEWGSYKEPVSVHSPGHPTVPCPPCALKWNRKCSRKKEQSSICCGFLSSRFSFASHSSPWEAGLHGNWYSLILPWLPLSSKDIGESLLDLQHLKYNWQILWWIQRSKFSMTTMLMLTDFVPEVRNWAFFSIFFLSE